MEADVQWDKCIICQAKLRLEQLKCPKKANVKDEEIMNTYEYFLQLVKKLRDAEVVLDSILKLPSHITAITLYQNNAKWHKSCRLRFSDTKVEALLKLKQKMNEESGETEEIQTPKRPRLTEFDNQKCIFCQKSTAEHLQAITTNGFGDLHKNMATEMNDTIMLLRLDKGDLVAAEGKYHRSCNTSTVVTLGHNWLMLNYKCLK